ncbi:unnamed protein product [Linum trigynum]|uniref:RING-type domain-containing protein n=1 Tax=Linum trigynum TaxID=586398 RepID=A0AAV2DZ64_9ROSI
MEEGSISTSPPPSFHSSPSHSAIDVDNGGSPSTSGSGTAEVPSGAASQTSTRESSPSSSSQVQEEDEDPGEQESHRFPEPEIGHHQDEVGVSNPGRNSPQTNGLPSLGDDTWSCVTVVLTFWCFISMTLIFGVYGPERLKLGPNCSLLIEPNPLFVQAVKVEELNDSSPGLMLYGFYESPPLDVVETWSDSHSGIVPSNSHEEWVYHLNEGSEINISYTVNSSSSAVFLVIAQGEEDFNQWLEEPAYPNVTLSWQVIHGSGAIYQRINRSSLYYVGVGNLNSCKVQVHLKITIRALLYDTSGAYYKCAFPGGLCSLTVLFLAKNPVLLTSPSTEQVALGKEWYVKLSYEPRWAIYILGIAGMSALMLVGLNVLNKFRSMNGERSGGGGLEPGRAPLLSNKDDDLSSWGSSYESVSSEENDLGELMAGGSAEGGKSSRDGENSSYTRRLCAICFDAPRDCFFLPCGHCVACFACGTRIAEASGSCPICRRQMKKVRKIYTV